MFFEKCGAQATRFKVGESGWYGRNRRRRRYAEKAVLEQEAMALALICVERGDSIGKVVLTTE